MTTPRPKKDASHLWSWLGTRLWGRFANRPYDFTTSQIELGTVVVLLFATVGAAL